MCSLNEGTKGSNIYAALESVIHDYGEYEKCSCIATDGEKLQPVITLDYSRFRLIGPPVNWVSRLIGPNC